jgi:hypothetical protein
MNPAEMTPIRLAPLTGIQPEYGLPTAEDEEKSSHTDNDAIETTTPEFQRVDIEKATTKNEENKKSPTQQLPQDNTATTPDSRSASPSTQPSRDSASDDEMNEIPVGKKLRVKPSGDGGFANETLLWLQIHISDILRHLSYQNFKFVVHECNKSVMVLFVDKQSWSTGMFYFVAGLVMSFICETLNGPKYNTSMLLCIMASVYFKSFPGNSVRPQLLITLLAALSFGLDIYYFTLPLQLVHNGAKALAAVAMVTKCLALYDFLWLSNGATKARKYLQRWVSRWLHSPNS